MRCSLRKHGVFLAFVACVSAVSVSTAQAQSGGSAGSQFEVDALGRAQRQGGSTPATASPQTLGPVVVTATRTPRRATDLITDVDTVSGTGLRASGALSLPEALDGLSGVSLSQTGGPGSATGLFLRGTSPGQTLTLIDGFRVSSVSLGQPVYEGLPFGLADRVEVLRGPASGLYGADAIGGVVQLLTPAAKPGTRFGGEAAFGTQGTRLLGASVSGGNASLTGGLHINDDRSDGFNAQREGSFGFNPDDDGYHRQNILAHATAVLSPQSRLRTVLLRNELDSAFDDGDFADARAIKRTELAGITSETLLTDGSLLTLRFGRSTDRVDSRSSFGGVIEGTQDQIGVVLSRTVAPGVDLSLNYDRLEQDVEAESYGDALIEPRKTTSIGGSLSGREGPHIVQLSLRRDRSNQYDEQTNGTFAYGYVLASGLRLGGAWATGFRAPGFNDLYFPGYGRADVRPESSRSLELGAYWDTRAGANSATGGQSPSGATAPGWHGKLVVYRNRIDDLIVFAPVCPDTGAQYASGCADNVNRASITGVSLSLGSRWGSLLWNVNADWLDPVDETLQRRLARRAEQQLSAQLGWQRDRLTLSATVKASGDRFDDPANTVRLAGFATANLGAVWAFDDQLSAFFNVVNVADRDYSTAAGYRSQPRTAMIGLRYDVR